MPDYLSEFKNRLNITWTDTTGDSNLASICKKAESILSKWAGKTLTFGKDMDDQELLDLLFTCVLYLRSNARSEFEENYFSDLNSLRMNVQAEVEEDDEEV